MLPRTESIESVSALNTADLCSLFSPYLFLSTIANLGGHRPRQPGKSGKLFLKIGEKSGKLVCVWRANTVAIVTK